MQEAASYIYYLGVAYIKLFWEIMNNSQSKVSEYPTRALCLPTIYQNLNASKQNKLKGLINIKNELWYLAYFSVSVWIYQSLPRWMELRLLIKKQQVKQLLHESN